MLEHPSSLSQKWFHLCFISLCFSSPRTTTPVFAPRLPFIAADRYPLTHPSLWRNLWDHCPVGTLNSGQVLINYQLISGMAEKSGGGNFLIIFTSSLKALVPQSEKQVPNIILPPLCWTAGTVFTLTYSNKLTDILTKEFKRILTWLLTTFYSIKTLLKELIQGYLSCSFGQLYISVKIKGVDFMRSCFLGQHQTVLMITMLNSTL